MSDLATSDLEQLQSDVAGAPQPSRTRRKQFLGELNDSPNQLHGPLAERNLRPPGGAKQVGDEPEVRPNHVCKEKRRSTGCYDAPMDLGDFKSRVYRGIDSNEIVRTTELIDEGSKVGERHL
jgi:hypothetical protein